jgi:alkylhydroperoxidase family enzyme
MSVAIRSAFLLSALAVSAPGEQVATSLPEVEGHFSLLGDEECWQKLPPAAKGGGQSLPSWARALAALMPRTTVALLQLDFVHRMRSPLDPKLRAQMRWVGAHANHCAYSEAYAAFDARRAGLDDDALEALRRGDYSQKTPAEKAALEFARKMTLDSTGITDGEFAALVQAYGEKKTAAMVLLMAYGSFQDRLILCLGSPLEAGGPKPPLEVVFAHGALRSDLANPYANQFFPFPPGTGKSQVEADPDWASLTYDQLQSRLESQRQRPTRLRIPNWEEVQRGLPAGFMRPNRVVWNLVHLGYVPELSMAWETLMRANAPETNSSLDRIFCVNLFWITARAINCSYCMGHTEMLWELAGLSQIQTGRVCQVLAGNDWSSFPREEQRSFAFARKVTRAPWSVTTEDIQSLKRDFGPVRAAAVIYWECRGNYMTRVANGFQLSLERDNVLREYMYIAKPPARAGRGQGPQGR